MWSLLKAVKSGPALALGQVARWVSGFAPCGTKGVVINLLSNST